MKTAAELSDTRLREALGVVKTELRKIAGEEARLIVYGSYARGEARPDSDVDLMVVLPDELKTFEMEDKVRDAIYDIGFDNDFLFSVMVASESHVKKMQGFMVYDSVEKEGILI